MKSKIKPVHPLQWIMEPLEQDQTFMQKKMFGAEVAYIDSRMVIALIAGEEPWNGLLVCTSRECHESLIKSFPQLVSHAILGKWLYVSQSHEDFESVAENICSKVLSRDPRIGIESKPKKAKGTRASIKRRTKQLF